MANRPDILLVTDNKTVLLEMGRDGKLSAKSNAWENNKVILEGEELVTRGRGRPLVHHQAPAGFWFSQGAPDEEDIEQAMAGAAVMDGLE
jgi:hypothetical protein